MNYNRSLWGIVNFDRYRRSPCDSMEKYIVEFEKLYVELPQSVLAFKLHDGILLDLRS